MVYDFELVDAFDLYPPMYSDMCLDIAHNILGKRLGPVFRLISSKPVFAT